MTTSPMSDISAISPQHKDSRHIISEATVQSKKHNENQLVKRVDFVRELPLELVSSLFLPPTLPITDRGSLSCLHVSKTWRQRVLQSTQLHFTSMLKLRRGPMHLLLAYAPYIQKISLSWHASFPFQFVSGVCFPSLKWLDLELSNSNDISHLYALLKSTSGALKNIYLKVHAGIRHESVQLALILRHCPHLEVFKCNQVFLAPLKHTYKKMKKLWIDSIVHTVSAETILALVEHLPALKHIRLPRCQDSSALPMIYSHCPRLRTLAYSTTWEAVVVFHESIVIKEYGLHSLTVEGGSNLHLQDVVTTLTACSNTIVNIDITVGMVYEGGSSLAIDQSVRFPRLRNITLCINDEDHGKELVRWILQHAPNARTIYAPPFNIDEPDIYETMKGMHYLMSIGSLAPSTTMISLMEHHSALGKTSALRKVKVGFNYNGEPRERILNAIVRLPQLEYLSLHLHGGGLGNSFVTYMETLADECPCLEELELHACHNLPDQVISIFPLYTNLKYLTVRCPNTWDECWLDLLECPALLSLDIPREYLSVEVEEALGDLF